MFANVKFSLFVMRMKCTLQQNGNKFALKLEMSHRNRCWWARGHTPISTNVNTKQTYPCPPIINGQLPRPLDLGDDLHRCRFIDDFVLLFGISHLLFDFAHYVHQEHDTDRAGRWTFSWLECWSFGRALYHCHIRPKNCFKTFQSNVVSNISRIKI